ncbi:hypothetical protein PONTUS_174 [Vibrio phage Pontus]|uniref:Uncharacterized protein n=1 Tax=Vibrio phage Pontus TaxID=2590874 RepID=A0A4Y6ECF7_9CAUD|nr:hypothetical protein KNU59_gp129 [Vibrio phage Pontus]QDF14799.1 hypothetical protein PONTUS_174 [Vibrio phage Pontus]
MKNIIKWVAGFSLLLVLSMTILYNGRVSYDTNIPEVYSIFKIDTCTTKTCAESMNEQNKSLLKHAKSNISTIREHIQAILEVKDRLPLPWSKNLAEDNLAKYIKLQVTTTEWITKISKEIEKGSSFVKKKEKEEADRIAALTPEERRSEARHKIYDIDFSYSEDDVSWLYVQAGGYCSPNNTRLANGVTKTQLVCKDNYYGSTTYYYYKNGVMYTIQD